MAMQKYDLGSIADLSTGHLPVSVRKMLDDIRLGTSTTLMSRSGYGYMMRPLKDRPAPPELPLEVVLVLDQASLQGFDMVQFDADGFRDPSLPWFEDGDVLLDAPSKVPLARFMVEFLQGMAMQKADPRDAVLFNMATLALRKFELDGHEPDREILIELRNSAAEFTYGEVPEDRLGHAIESLRAWRPELAPELEI